jgi:transcriptional regulator with XRE-family HTH domain
MKIQDILKDNRERCGLTIKECAEFLGVSSSTYRDWEYGRAITGEPYLKIAELFGISILELFGKSPSKSISTLNEIEHIVDELVKKLRVLKSNL